MAKMSALAAQSAAKGYPDVSVAWMHPDRVSLAERNKCAERGSSVCDEQFDEDSDGPDGGRRQRRGRLAQRKSALFTACGVSFVQKCDSIIQK